MEVNCTPILQHNSGGHYIKSLALRVQLKCKSKTHTDSVTSVLPLPTDVTFLITSVERKSNFLYLQVAYGYCKGKQ